MRCTRGWENKESIKGSVFLASFMWGKWHKKRETRQIILEELADPTVRQTIVSLWATRGFLRCQSARWSA